MNDAQILQLVINTLNTIEVHGESNLNALLGCIQTLQKLIPASAQARREEVDVGGV